MSMCVSPSLGQPDQTNASSSSLNCVSRPPPSSACPRAQPALEQAQPPASTHPQTPATRPRTASVVVAGFKSKALLQMLPILSTKMSEQSLPAISTRSSLVTQTLAIAYPSPPTHSRCSMPAKTVLCCPSSSTTAYQIPLMSVC